MRRWLFLEKLLPAHRRAQRGQTLVIFAFLAVFMILLLGLVLDSVRLFILAAEAERTAEAATLAGALYMPKYFNTLSPDGQDAMNRACATAQANGVSACPVGAGQIGADVEQVTGNQYEIQVTVTLQADVFFLSYVAPNLASATVSRTAVAQYLPPIQLGSRSAAFGDEADGVQSFWASINGPYELKEQGDAYTPKWEEGPTDPVKYPDSSSSPYNYSRWTPAQCCTNHQQWPTAITNPDQQSAGFTYSDGSLTAPGYSYEIDVPSGVGNVQVQIYNAVFDPSNSNNTNDSLGSACDDPTFNSGGCKKDKSNEYLQMHYALYSAPLQFERGTDTLLTHFSPATLEFYGDHGCTGTTGWDPVLAFCATPTNHTVEDWYTLYTITQPGTYRLTVAATGYYGWHSYGVKLVDSSSVSITSLTPSGTALSPATDGPHVWGWNTECVHFDAATSTATFDLGEIPAAYAGKTLSFSLFDPGEVNAPANNTMEILDPSGNPVQWPSWARTASGSGGTQLSASINGDRYYNGLWLHVPVAIPATYNPAAGSDWWQVQYAVTGGGAAHDTITISISLGGSPVHLVSEVVG